DEYAQQNKAYYTDEYSDDEYYEDEYGDLEYANRINRFYYSTPGMSYYDPVFDPWFGFNTWGYGYGGYGGRGFGYSNWGWNRGWGLGFGWGYPYSMGYPYYSHIGWGWGNPYHFYTSYCGMSSCYTRWGRPYYGGGYGIGSGGYVTRPAYSSVRSNNRGLYDTRVSNSSTDRRATVSRSVSRDANGRI